MDVQPIPNEALIQQALEGSEIAFETLYKRYYPRIRAFLKKMVENGLDADDLTQEVLVTVFKKREQFNPIVDLVWMHKKLCPLCKQAGIRRIQEARHRKSDCRD